MTKASAVRVAYRWLDGGVLSAPPEMVEAISDWLVGVAATEALRQIQEQRDAFTIPDGPRWKSLVKPGRYSISEADALEYRRGFLDEYDEVERMALQFGGHKPKSLRLPEYIEQKFPLDLRGWKHRGMVENALEKRRRDDPRSLWLFDKLYDPIKVVVYPKRAGSNMARATWGNGFLTVWGLGVELQRKDTFQPYIKHLSKTIRHELQHMAQDLLREATGAQSAGGAHGVSSPHPRDTLLGEEHALRDEEFHTRLQDDIDVFQEQYAPKVGDIRAAIQAFVGSGPRYEGIEPTEFFTALKRYDREKWRRAVAELVSHVLR